MKLIGLYCIVLGVVVILVTAAAWWSLSREQQAMIEDGSEA